MLKLRVTQKAISGAVSKDSISRPGIRGVYFDPETGDIVATNGYIMVIIPVQVEGAEDSSFILPVSAFPKKLGNTTEIERDGGKLTVTERDKKDKIVETRIVDVLNEQFTEYKKVIPWAGEKSAQPVQIDRIALNIEYLTALGAIAESLGRMPDFLFTFYGELKAVRLDNNVFTGLIMPIRLT